MQLTRFTDYAMRIVLYLGVRGEDVASVAEIADSYGISRNHLAKVAQKLAGNGIVEATRGRNGGLRLNKPPSEINLGQLVRTLEPDMQLVDCIGCLIAPVCGIPKPLAEATNAFLKVLDGYSLNQLIAASPNIETYFPRPIEPVAKPRRSVKPKKQSGKVSA